MRYKKGMNAVQAQLLGALVIGVAIIGGLYFFSAGGVDGTPTVVIEESDKNICAENLNIDGKFRVQDKLASSTKYLAGTIYVQNLDNGVITEVTGNSSGFATSSNIYDCLNEAGYEVSVKTEQDTYNAVEEIATITPTEIRKGIPKTTLKGSNHSLIKAKGYDLDARASMFNSTNSTDYTTLSGGLSLYCINGSGDCARNYGDFFDLEFTLKPVTASEASGKNLLVAVNYKDETDTSDWNGDSLAIYWDGVKVEEFTPVSNDISALSGYEKYYIMPYPVGMDSNRKVTGSNKLRFYLEATSDSGVTVDFEPVVRFVALGDYLDDDDPTKILRSVGFRTDASLTEIGSASTSTITIKTS